MDVEIRRLGPGDGHVLDRVAAEVFDEPVRPDRLAAYLAQPNRDGVNPGEKYVRVALVHPVATIREALERVVSLKA